MAEMTVQVTELLHLVGPSKTDPHVAYPECLKCGIDITGGGAGTSHVFTADPRLWANPPTGLVRCKSRE